MCRGLRASPRPLGSGVCQDYAHILLALARRSGFAARYCMGLVPGEGATHAWVEIALPDGWHGYDPTFACEAGEEHLRFAVGRDAADCRAERGIFIPSVEHDGIVKKGQELAVIADPLTGEVRQTLMAPADGLLFTLREYPVVYPGSLLARILTGGFQK